MIDEPVISERATSAKISTILWVSFLICFLCNVSAGLISTLMSVFLPVVVQDLAAGSNSSLDEISAYINALYIAGWAAGGFVWGFVSDKIGRAKALSLSVAIFGLCTLLISFSPSWLWVVTFRLLSGLAVGGILVITPTLLYEIWPPRSRAVIIGIDSIGFPVGIFSSGLVNVLVDSWRGAFLVGLVPIALGITALLILRESEQWKTADTDTTTRLATTSDRQNLVRGSIIFGSMLIGLWGMFSWIPTWVQSLLDSSDGQTERGIAMMLLGAGGLTGGFISGWISNRLGVRKAMMFCFGGCIVLSALLFGTNANFSPVIYIELAMLSLFFGISQGLLSIFIPQLFPVHIRGTYSGICFNTGRFVTAIAIFFVGVFVTILGGYSNTLLAFAGIFPIGFITMFMSKDQHKQH